MKSGGFYKVAWERRHAVLKVALKFNIVIPNNNETIIENVRFRNEGAQTKHARSVS